MKDAVLILNFEAISDAVELCNTLGDHEVYLFDIALADWAIAAGLTNVKLVTQIAGPSYRDMDRAARAIALTLERDLDAAQRAAGSDVSIVGWQHLNFYHFFMMRQWYVALWDLVGGQLRGRHVHVLINDNPAEYYFDSFVPPLSLVTHLKRCGIPFTAYDYGAKPAPAYPVPDLSSTAPAGFAGGLLTHLPTCIHDGEHFHREIRAAGLPWVDLASRYWDVDLQADMRLGLTTVERVLTPLGTPAAERIDAAVDALRDRLLTFSAPHLEPAHYHLRQVEHWVRLYRAQFVMYAGLLSYFREHQPAKLLLAGHDAGFLGPLIAFAAERSLPVVMLPHSKFIGDIEFGGDGVLALTHPAQGGPVHDVDGRKLRHLPILFPERFSGSSLVGGELRSICLLLNSTSQNGIPDAQSDVFLDGIRRIVSWCRDHGVSVKTRCKPGFPIFGLLTSLLGFDVAALTRWMEEPLEQHARDCDLCLMYEAPTTGAIVFLRNSIPILNPIVSEMSKQWVAMLHADVVVAESVDATLRRLEQYKADPLTLDEFRLKQFRAYISRYRGARPLRSFLDGRPTVAAQALSV